MSATFAFFLFAAALLVCVITGTDTLWAMFFGYFVFFTYGLCQKYTVRSMLRFTWNGIWSVRLMFPTFLMIGVITGLWRICGTIPTIIYYAAGAISPMACLLLAFLLCGLVSFLTGTAIGTAGTMGIICMTMGRAMGVDTALMGGAILAGSYFGDRCSPMSTSAMLVCGLTDTNIYDNIKAMSRTAAVPFLVSCILYGALGFFTQGGTGGASNITGLFSAHFSLELITALPAAIIVILSLFRVKVLYTLCTSAVMACLVAWFCQGAGLLQIAESIVLGFHPADAQLAACLSGGGLVSMVRVLAIVCTASSFAGIFKGTGFLAGLQGTLEKLSKKLNPFASTLLIAAVTAMVSCSQILTVMLTHQLCGTLLPDKREMAIALEDTAVIIAGLVPWSVASTGVLGTVGAPILSVAAACYMYLIPLWGLLLSFRKQKKATTLA